MRHLQAKHRRFLFWVIPLVLSIAGILFVARHNGWFLNSDIRTPEAISDEVNAHDSSLGVDIIPEYVLSELDEDQREAIRQAFDITGYRLIGSESHDETLEQSVGQVLNTYEKQDALLRWNGFLDVQGQIWAGLFQEKRWIDLCLIYINTQESTRTLTWRLDFNDLKAQAQELLHV